MGREFTNALHQTPLWQFALKVYPAHQRELLAWQNDKNAQVNDIIAIAFCLFHKQSLPLSWWRNEQLLAVRELTCRLRKIRVQAKETEQYALAKQFELNMEGLDILLLQQMVIADDANNMMQSYEFFLKIKKGALAPLVERLVNAA